MAASLWLPQLPLGSSLSLTSRRSGGHSRRPTAQAGATSFSRRTSPSSSVVTLTEKGEQEERGCEAAAAPVVVGSFKDDPNFKGCKGCGREQVESGCNGQGRVQGGIATVPGFGWWPIKAYRPCPAFLASGGRYRRQGQSMDDVASGRGRRPLSRPTQRDRELRR